MFKNNKKAETENATIVTTKEQLKAAVNRKDPCIEVRGDLAKKMRWMTKLSKEKMALIIAALAGATAAAPVTGGTSFAVVGAVSTETMATVAILGGVAVVAILKGYSVEVETADGNLKLTKNK